MKVCKCYYSKEHYPAQ